MNKALPQMHVRTNYRNTTTVAVLQALNRHQDQLKRYSMSTEGQVCDVSISIPNLIHVILLYKRLERLARRAARQDSSNYVYDRMSIFFDDEVNDNECQ